MEEAKRSNLIPSLDIETICVLEQEILPQLISRARLSDRVMRLWLVEWNMPELPMLVCLLLARLLGQALSHFRLSIFVTVQNEERVSQAYRNNCSREALAHFSDEELERFCEPAGDGYCLSPALRNLLIFGRHNPFHDPFFARLDLIICGLFLHTLSIERQQQFLIGISASLNRSGFFVCQRADAALLARFPFVPFREGLPLYQLANRSQPPERHPLLEEKQQSESDEPAAQKLLRLLQMPRNAGETVFKRPTSPSPSQAEGLVPRDILLRLAPVGIVVLNHCYQLLTLNRAAHKLLTPLIREESHCDFFHAISGLPYQEVRTAIDTVMREGISQSLPEVELSVSDGGNGRVLSFEICAMPTEIGYPPQVILYIWDVTMQTVHQKIQLQQALTIQELGTANTDLKKQYGDLEHAHEHLQEVSHQLLLDYECLTHQFEEAQESLRQLDRQVEQLVEEITLLTEQLNGDQN